MVPKSLVVQLFEQLKNDPKIRLPMIRDNLCAPGSYILGFALVSVRDHVGFALDSFWVQSGILFLKLSYCVCDPCIQEPVATLLCQIWLINAISSPEMHLING